MIERENRMMGKDQVPCPDTTVPTPSDGASEEGSEGGGADMLWKCSPAGEQRMKVRGDK